MGGQHVESAPDAGQHAKRENIDLENAQRIEIVLVPFDDGAVLHRRVGDGHDFIEPRAGDDEAARVLREMARETAISFARRTRCAVRVSSALKPARAAASPGPSPPHTVEDSALNSASSKPKTLPTSRSAERPR